MDPAAPASYRVGFLIKIEGDDRAGSYAAPPEASPYPSYASYPSYPSAEVAEVAEVAPLALPPERVPERVSAPFLEREDMLLFNFQNFQNFHLLVLERLQRSPESQNWTHFVLHRLQPVSMC